MAELKKKKIKKVVKKISKPKKRVLKKLGKKVVSKSKSKKIFVKKKVVKRKLTKKRVLKKKSVKKVLKLKRSVRNPIIVPTPYPWESFATFNPAAVVSGGRVHLFYRALGPDGISRIGYASSRDGVNFDIRLTYPVYIAQNFEEAQKHWPMTSPARLVYDPSQYTSGGGWGGCEDPRVVIIDGTVYMTFNMFNGWHSMRVAVTSIKEEDLLAKKWLWKNFSYLSRGTRQKNWVLFPERINGKFVILYNLDKGDANKVHIKYMQNLDINEAPTDEEAIDPQMLGEHNVAWHYRTRSPASPPIKTKDGWLLLYHAMERSDSGKYKVGAMLLDLKNPERVLYRAQNPILEPDNWYENDYKPGIVYASGAVVKDGKLLVYYGGGDKYVAMASIEMEELLDNLKHQKPINLKKGRLFRSD